MNEYDRRKNILDFIVSEMERAEDIDTINKLYRQARAWNRFDTISERKVPDKHNPVYVQFNETLKIIRNEYRAKLK